MEDVPDTGGTAMKTIMDITEADTEDLGVLRLAFYF